MLSPDLRRHLEALRDGGQSVDGMLEILRDLPYQDIGFAKIDHHRPLRKGFPEVVLGKGKSPEQISEIVENLKKVGYLWVSLDLAGLRSGSLNDQLELVTKGNHNGGRGLENEV